MTEVLDTPILTLQLLFTTAQGSAALVAFFEKTKIVTASWLLAAGALYELRTSTRKQQTREYKDEVDSAARRTLKTAADSTEL
jgi:hypothetical protein